MVNSCFVSKHPVNNKSATAQTVPGNTQPAEFFFMALVTSVLRTDTITN
jgi:hypothetical protein